MTTSSAASEPPRPEISEQCQQMLPRIRLACGWALVALIGVVINLVVLIAAPVLRPDLDLFQKSLSYYAVGPWGIVQAIAFGALGISSVALGPALHRSGLASRWLWPTVLLADRFRRRQPGTRLVSDRRAGPDHDSRRRPSNCRHRRRRRPARRRPRLYHRRPRRPCMGRDFPSPRSRCSCSP